MSKARKSRSLQKSPSPHNSNQVRIIGGDWRGRKLDFPAVDGLRPTGDRMRETLFNWLGPYLPESKVVDLFSGSGSLGFESLSRGAGSAHFVEKDSLVAKSIQNNLKLLGAQQKGALFYQSAFSYLDAVAAKSCDILFVDPPFSDDLHNEILAIVEKGDMLSDGAIVYIEAPKDAAISAPPKWSLYREKVGGKVRYLLYKKSGFSSND